MPFDRKDISYQLTFIPEAGIDQPPSLVAEAHGWDHAVGLVEEQLDGQYSSSDWLEPDSGYGKFVKQNERVFDMFVRGEISCAAFIVPYGILVIG